MSTTIFTDSACGLPPDDASAACIRIVSLYLNESGTSIPEVDVDREALLARIARTGPLPTTSQPTPEDYAAAFRKAAAEGQASLAVLVSAKMSGSIQAAELGAEMARAEVPGATIIIVDSESNSMQEGFAVLAAAECARNGGSIEESAAAAQASVARSRFLFTPRSLDQLAEGGRISNAAALLGHTLKVCPILTAKEGSTGVAAVVRTRRRALNRMADLMRADVERCGLARVVVQSIVETEDAEAFARELIAPIAGTEVSVVPGPLSVGVHVGPAVGVVYETVDPLR